MYVLIPNNTRSERVRVDGRVRIDVYFGFRASWQWFIQNILFEGLYYDVVLSITSLTTNMREIGESSDT